MSEDQFVSLLRTGIWAVAFVVSVWVISKTFGSLIRRSLEQNERRTRLEENHRRARAEHVR